MTTTSARIFQWIGIMVIAAMLAVAYWYFNVRANTLNQSQNDSNTSSLVGMWSFNGDDMSGTTATDRGTGGNNGTLTNGPTKVVGQVGQALDFDGSDDYVTVADSATLDATDTADLTLSGWFNRESFTTDDTIIAKRNGITSTDTGYILYIDDATDQLIFEVSDGTDEYSLTSKITVTATGWHHFLVVWDQDTADNIKLYIDGMADTVTPSGTLANIGDLSNALAFRMGAESDNGNPFDGRLDEIRVYNRTLSIEEARDLFIQGSGTSINTSISQAQGTGRLDSGLTGYYKLDDGSGTSATDSSTNNSPGTLTGAGGVPTWTTGYMGGGVDFDGVDDYIATTKTIPSKGTVAVWVNAGFGLEPTAQYTIAGASISGNSFVFEANTAAAYNTWHFAIRGGFSVNTLETKGTNYGSDSQIQGWRHVVATWDTTQGISLYVDGTLAGTDMRPTGTFGTMTYSIGRDASTNYWNGDMDEVRMYDRMLSGDEVAQLYRLTQPMAVDADLNGFWSFNGQDMLSTTTTADRSGAGNTGTLTNGPTKVVGQVGQALDFDGSDDYVTVADSATLDATDTADLTLSGWFNRESFTTDDTIIAKRNGITSTDTGYILYIDDATDQLIFEVSDGTDEYSITSQATFTSTGWHYYAIVWDQDSPTNSELYIDGIANIATDSGTIGNIGDLSNALAFRMGAESDNGNPFDGKIDEVRVYSRTLTAAEIKAQYDAGQTDKQNSSISQPQGTGRLDSGLAGYWALDDGSGTSAADSSTNANTGTLTNFPGSPTWTTGQIGGGLDFDGTNDYVTMPDNNAVDMVDGQNFTLAGWFNRDTFATDDVIVSKRNTLTSSADVGYGVNIDDATDKLVLDVTDGTDEYELSSASTFTSTGWNHFVVAWVDSVGAKIYINGVEETTTSTGTFANVNSIASGSTSEIGSDGNGGTNFDGKLDEIRIYNRALSSDEVAQLYRLTTPTGVDTGLKGYWSFNGQDLLSTTAYDRSGAGNNGTLTSSPGIAIGKLGQALVFDGTNYVTAADSASLSPTAALSVAFWAKRTDTFASANRVYTAKSESSARSWGVAVQTTGAVRFYVASSSADSSGNYVATTSTPITQNNWFHIVAVFDGSQSTDTTRAKIYVNGSLQTSTATGTINTSLTDTTADLKIGYGGANNYGSIFKGPIDEVRVYNRALSAAEVASLYNSSR